MGEKHNLCAKSPHTSECEKNGSFLRESFYVRNKRVLQHGSYGEFSLLFKGVLPTSQCFLDQQHHLSAESPHSRE
jgi:hypothetical protein